MNSIEQRIADELGVRIEQVAAAVALLDGGATVPFVARYRKEATGGLDDVQLRALEQRLGYLRELEERREAILKSIAEQGKLTPGMHIPVVGAEKVLEEKPAHLVVLAWNFFDEIVKQQDAYRKAGGKFVVPVPSPQVR